MSARRLILLLGWVSLLADLCYEGMRSAIGGYLQLLGASATAVGVVAGIGEAIGYGLRYASGALADRTHRYWALAIAGYATNIVAVPLLALAGSWPMVAGLVALERLGKAIRSPAKSTITSFAARDVGAGKAFAITEAMDQIGGMLGPLAVAAILFWQGPSRDGYGWAFALLAIPALLAVAVALRARAEFPDPSALEREPAPEQAPGLRARYWIYLAGVSLIAIGLADWPLLAFHLQRDGVVTAPWIPVVYAGAMAADGVAALIAGALFDRARGRGALVVALFALIGAAYGPLVLATAAPTAVFGGIALWAIARAATESINKAMIATLVAKSARGRAYGLYYVVWGLAWLIGSVLLGALYDRSAALAGATSAIALASGAIVIALVGSRERSV